LEAFGEVFEEGRALIFSFGDDAVVHDVEVVVRVGVEMA
jgi:hypothetical protein